MPGKKKKFIEKKNAVTFHLVHRSQQDPLAADENAPQHVLLQQKSKKDQTEEHKYGIFFEDDYDYMQHLKSVNDQTVTWGNAETNKLKSRNDSKVKVKLPSSVFASEVEEPVGLLNKAAPIYGPRPELDPDIVAAMDDDFDYDDPDNLLEDNFIQLANQECSSEDYEGDEEEEDEDYDDEADDDIGSLENDVNFEEVETKSRFTDYSLTSSVIRRNEQLTLLDRRFEKMFEAYEESEIGPLECEEIEGNISVQDKMLIELAESTMKKEENDKTNELDIKEKILSVVDKESASEEEKEEMDCLVIPEKEKWDCESILSTYSNLYNHPAKILEPKGPGKIRISKKTGIPLDVLGGTGGPRLTAHNLSLLDQSNIESGPKSVISQLSELSIRPKNETPDERKTRKQNLKIYRRERRLERKANTLAFKEEKKRQEKVMLNLKNNLQGTKII